MSDDTIDDTATHLTSAELDAGLDHVRSSPSQRGTIEMIVARPDVDERRVLDEAELVIGEGLAGDNYVERGNQRTPDGKAHPEAQLTLMSSRSVDLIAGGDRARWALAGDQFFVDLDLSAANAPAGTRFLLGTAVIEVSQKPHTGCNKFAQRFGIDAARWVNADDNDRRRGINAVVVEAGLVRSGDEIVKL